MSPRERRRKTIHGLSRIEVSYAHDQWPIGWQRQSGSRLPARNGLGGHDRIGCDDDGSASDKRKAVEPSGDDRIDVQQPGERSELVRELGQPSYPSLKSTSCRRIGEPAPHRQAVYRSGTAKEPCGGWRAQQSVDGWVRGGKEHAIEASSENPGEVQDVRRVVRK
jgi:hypothetical protein